MAYGLDKLKTIRCLDAVTIRVPERWSRCGPSGNDIGSWSCYEDDEETGTLWITVNRFTRPDTTPPGPGTRAVVEEMVGRQAQADVFQPLVESSITDVPEGYLWALVHDGVEDGMPLRFFRYFFYLFRDGKMAIADFNFVLPIQAIEESEEIRTLIGTMDREIRAACIDPFAVMEEAGYEDMYRPLRRVNFADRVALELPAMVDGEATEEGVWHCTFADDDVPASMWVTASDIALLDDEDHEPVSPPDDLLEEVLERMCRDDGDLKDSWSRIEHVPWGIVAFHTYDDPEEESSETGADGTDWRNGAFHNCLWRLMAIGHGRARRVQVLLMMADAWKDTPQARLLVRLVDRAVHAAEFPDLPPREA